MHAVVGSGALGGATAKALVAAGIETRMLSRSGRPASGATPVAVDARDTSALTRALDGAEVVYQCAQPPYPRWTREFPALQESILTAAAAVGARVVVCDNLYGYGRPDGVLREESPRRPTSKKGDLRLRMADEALEFGRRNGTPVTLLRPSNYFGPGYDRVGQDVFAAANRGSAMRFLGSLDQPHSLSYVPDVGRAMAALGSSTDAWGEAWIGPTLPPLTQRAFARAVWDAAGRTGTPKTTALSRGATQVVGIFSPLVRELTEMMYEYDEPFVVDSSRIAERFGIRPTPLATAIRETLAAYPA